MASNPKPEILTQRQFAVIAAILKSPNYSQGVGGREVHAMMKKLGVKVSRASFYELMARCESKRFVDGSWRTLKRDDEGNAKTRERVYRLDGPGATAYDATRAFYAQSGLPANLGGEVAS